MTTAPLEAVERRAYVVRGVVQGVGFRPFVARLAAELSLRGECGNDATSVFVDLEGPAAALTDFERRLKAEAPPLSHIVDVATTGLPPCGFESFRIVSSRTGAGMRTLVPPDVATCDDCLAEFSDPRDRRYRHPFITCTNCGPRFTIIEDLPYDREVTTMAGFPMCLQCAAEYDAPADRRHHAQPVSCHDCGPRLWLEIGEREISFDAESAIGLAADLLSAGGIVAVKGIGGFHLACDPTNAEAVRVLRERKHRPDKPFALMARDLLAAASVVELAPAELDALTQPARPIVLAAMRPEAAVADGVAPGLDELGIMLPYTPVHHLLLERFPLLVMTSGNLSDEPLCWRNDDAHDRLGGIADAFLMHDRDIAVPCEDSVVTVLDGVEQPVRRSRGFAPLPVLLPDDGPSVLAVGAEVKNTFTLTRGDLALISAHLGDMASLESRAAFNASVSQLESLHAVEPELLVADQHPAYLTRMWAEDRSEGWGTPLETVQHHHAHLASLLAEHGRLGDDVIGIAFDGTGYSCDRTIWGGELLHSPGNVTRIERVGHLAPFALPGGDAAVREPWRVALSLLDEAGVAELWGLDLGSRVDPAALRLVRSQLASGQGLVRTSSAGRLFDGIASLLGVRHAVTFEAQAAMELERLARSSTLSVRLSMPVRNGVFDHTPLVRELVGALRDGADVPALARGFHEALAEAAALAAIRLSAERDVGTIGLTGGVMQNRLLVAHLTEVLRRSGLEVLTHRRVPPNDGGLSLGQAVIGRELLRRNHSVQDRSGRERGERPCV